MISPKRIKHYGELLEFATGRECLYYEEVGTESGDYIAILRAPNNDGLELWKDHYGSCPECDWIMCYDYDGAKPYIIHLEDAKKYMRETQPFLHIPQDKLLTVLEADDISQFFPRNTRINYNKVDWEWIRVILGRTYTEYKRKELK